MDNQMTLTHYRRLFAIANCAMFRNNKRLS